MSKIVTVLPSQVTRYGPFGNEADARAVLNAETRNSSHFASVYTKGGNWFVRVLSVNVGNEGR